MQEEEIEMYELDKDRTSNGRENASTAFARESRAATPTGGSEESARGKRAREREECKRTAEGSSEKDLIRVEGNGRETRWWCDRAPLPMLHVYTWEFI